MPSQEAPQRVATAANGRFVCRICRAEAATPCFSFDGYTVARCSTCTGEFLEPQPSDAALASIYTEEYFFKNSTDAERTRHRILKRATAQKSIEAILAAGAPGGGRLLEIGGGTGDFLLEAEARGYDVTGIEYSATSAAATQARIRGRVIVGTLESADFPDASFDIVANSDVIEHVRDPLAFAREMRRVLRPGGISLVATPSLDSWSRRVMRRSWVEYKIEHLFYFNHKSISLLLRQAGFDSITIKPNVKSLSLDYIAGHFEKFPIPLWSPVVGGVRRLIPDALAQRPFDIVASGMLVTAR